MALPRAAVLLACLAALTVPAGAHARVTVVAMSDGALLTDVASNRVVAHLSLGGRGRAVAMRPDGTRAYVAAGDIHAIDLRTRSVADTGVLPVDATALALSPDGRTLYAGRPGAIDLMDAEPMGHYGFIALGDRTPRSLAVSPDGRTAYATLDGRAVAAIDLAARRVRRIVKLSGATGLAVDAAGDAWVSAPGRLVKVSPTATIRRSIGTGRGVGGGVVLLGSSRAVVGASRGSRVTSFVDLHAGRQLARVAAGAGPGRPAVSPDGLRVYVADRGAGTVSVLSTGRFRRLAVQPLGPVSAPEDVAVQPGIATTIGTAGPDRLTGTRLADALYGLEGDDLLSGGRGNDLLYGGPGDDTLSGGGGNDRLFGEAGADRLSTGAGNDAIDGGEGDDNGHGGTGNDTLEGGEGNDYLDGGEGDDELRGGRGDDKLIDATFGNDKLLDGGEGDDHVDGGRGSDRLVGGAGDDTLFGRSGSETIDAGEGNDTLDGGTGGDRLYGREGDDSLRGDAGSDRLYGADGVDALDGGSGDDYLTGGDGGDEIVAGPGRDEVDGGSGNDVIRVADGDRDIVACGPGRDTVYVEEDAPDRDRLSRCEIVVAVPAEPATDDPPATNVITGGRGRDVIFGTPGPDTLLGGDGPDELFGNEGDDYVDGENGADVLHGGPGNDSMHGRHDDDVILGNDGNDHITGDRGRDTINGEGGDDVIFGNLDDDVVEGGEGNDRINVVAGGSDRVSCGPGTDVVFADASDFVAADCESVRR